MKSIIMQRPLKHFLISILLLLPLFVTSQSIVFTPITELEVNEISLEQVTKNKSGYYGAAPGNKYVALKGTLYTKAQRRIEFPLYKLFLKTQGSTYMAISDLSYVPFSDLDRFISFKKKKKANIYFEVDENFKEALLIYDRRILGTVKMIDSINAEFIARDEEEDNDND